MLKKLHLISGVLFLFVFAITGAYMLFVLNLPEQPFDASRMMYRASHMYLLIAACVNVMAGIHWQRFSNPVANQIQVIGSILLLVMLPLFLWAFLVEPREADMERGLTFWANVSLLTGTGLSLLALVWQKRSAD